MWRATLKSGLSQKLGIRRCRVQVSYQSWVPRALVSLCFAMSQAAVSLHGEPWLGLLQSLLQSARHGSPGSSVQNASNASILMLQTSGGFPTATEEVQAPWTYPPHNQGSSRACWHSWHTQGPCMSPPPFQASKGHPALLGLCTPLLLHIFALLAYHLRGGSPALPPVQAE